MSVNEDSGKKFNTQKERQSHNDASLNMKLVRFAPSPTGLLHVGNIRIAILNYLFAKKCGCGFVLRIDDTDVERSTKESENLIIEDLQWIGISWDKFYRQSDNFEYYRKTFECLKSVGRVYPCYETKEQLSLKRKSQMMSGVPPVYDRSSLKLTEAEKKDLENNGIKPYWRFKLNESESAEWVDLVHGKICIPLNTISDPVLVKPDGSFVYTFASVVDDINIGITHIIRGDDHITNTAAQIDIFKAIADTVPEFAHVPLLSSIDGQDVSKRTGSPLSIVNMRNSGVLPEAILNVLSALGTSSNVDPHDNINSLIEKFSFEKMSLSSPKFNIDDVKLVSKKIIVEKSFDDIKTDLEKIGFKNISENFWDTIKGNIDSINDVPSWYNAIFNDENKHEQISKEDSAFVDQMLEFLSNPIDFDCWISCLKKASGRKGKNLFHPIRVILTGLDYGPELKKIIDLLGYDLVKNKIEKTIESLR